MEVNLKTKLVTRPCPKEILNYIQLGTTPTLSFDLSNKIYTFEDISQVMFIFRQGNSNPVSYSMIQYSNDNQNTWSIDDHFEYNKTLNEINFTFTSQETLQFIPSKKGDRSTYINFQIIIKLLLDGQEKEVIINNNENDIYVIDTLYRKIIQI